MLLAGQAHSARLAGAAASQTHVAAGDQPPLCCSQSSVLSVGVCIPTQKGSHGPRPLVAMLQKTTAESVSNVQTYS